MKLKLWLLASLIIIPAISHSHKGGHKRRKIAQEEFSPSECPVVGNLHSKKYHVPGGIYYKEMLILNRDGIENRKCFLSEEAAIEDGFIKSKN